MTLNNKVITSVPPSIELLFNNEKLELMKVLCLVYALSLQSKKRRKVSEILFYYSLVNFELLKLFEVSEERNNGFSTSPNLYFRFQKKINWILLNLSNLNFVVVRGDISKKLEDITVQLTPKGKGFFEELNSDYFSNLQGRYINVFDKVKFSAENLKILKGAR